MSTLYSSEGYPYREIVEFYETSPGRWSARLSCTHARTVAVLMVEQGVTALDCKKCGKRSELHPALPTENEI